MRRTALRWIIPTFLALQLALLWLQGAQLYRQNQLLEGLRQDVQALADSLEASQGPPSDDGAEGAAVPVSFFSDPPPKPVAVLGVEDEQSSATKELQEARDSAQKAVKDAREAQSKLSLEENARKAEEAQKVQAATHAWQRWVWGAIGLVVLALVVRSVLRRRG